MLFSLYLEMAKHTLHTNIIFTTRLVFVLLSFICKTQERLPHNNGSTSDVYFFFRCTKHSDLQNTRDHNYKRTGEIIGNKTKYALV